MEALLYFVLWGAAIFLMMRFGCGAHVMGHGQGQKAGRAGTGTGAHSDEGLRWVAPRTDVDPVCGQTVSTDKAKPSVFAGIVHYFCSRECREIFEATPGDYLGTRGDQPPQALEHRHG